MSYSRSSAIALLLLLPSIALALSPDETILLNRVRAIAAAPVEDFRVLGESGGARDGCYRYQLAFLEYGLFARTFRGWSEVLKIRREF